jgi:radical SAM protein with 4Fe4S-binding SPASM domain
VPPERLQLFNELANEVNRLKEGQIQINFPSLSQLSAYFAKSGSKIKWKCFSGYNRISISPTGEVFTCHEEHFGNAREDDLKSIWYGSQAKHLRQKFKKCKRNCLQLCYTRAESESLYGIFKDYFKKLNMFH